MMKLPIRKNLSHRVIGFLAATTLTLPILATQSSHAQLAECRPIQITHTKIINAKPLFRSGRVTGISYRLQSTVKNTNPTFVHMKSFDAYAYMVGKVNSRDRGSKMFLHNMPRNMAGNKTITIYSRPFTMAVKSRNPQTLPLLLQGNTYNPQCDQGKQQNYSNFSWDLAPVLNGGEPRQGRSTKWGYTENKRILRPRT